MLSKRLEEISRDPEDPNSIAELAVTALGTQGSYYICWKTRSGHYEQDSHGLPPDLSDWLFPPQGGSRNFETLQVILGPGDGDFFASDCNGTVEKKASEPRIKPRLERASTLRSLDGSLRPHRLSSAENGEMVDYTTRRRSATVSLGRYSNPRASLLGSRSSFEHTQEGRTRQVVPLALAREPDQSSQLWRQSTSNIGAQRRSHTEIFRRMRRSQSPQDLAANENMEDSPYQLHALRAARYSPPPAPSAQKTLCSYVDASVQTDTLQPPSPPIEPNVDHDYYRGHVRDWSSASSISTTATSYSSGASSRRSSVKVDTTAKPYLPAQQALSNPIRMGRMQDYFRSNTYQLGDSMSFSPLGCSP